MTSAVTFAEATPGLLACAMVLAPREQETWRQSLDSCLAAGLAAGEPLKLIAEPGMQLRSRDLPKGVSLFQNRIKRGVWSNWLFAAQHLLAYTTAPWLAILEDDALVCPCAGAAIQQAAVSNLPALGCLSLYTPKRSGLAIKYAEGGWLVMEEQPWGSVALCFPRESLMRLLETVDRGPTAGTDQLIYQTFNKLQLSWYTHKPSLADHIGFTSTIGHAAGDDARGLDFRLDYDGYRSVPVRTIRQVAAAGGLVEAEGQPLVSVVLPVYNDARYVRQAIGSVLAQTYRHIELVVVDDGSTDETPQILEEYRMPNVRLLKHETNRNLPAALNTGFAATTGEYLTWISSDNMCHPQMIGEMLSYLLARPETDVVYSNMEAIDEHGASLGHWETGEIENISMHNPVGLSFLYRRKVYEEVGDYDESLFLAEDYHFWLRVARRFRVDKLPKTLHYYRQHPGQLTEKYKERVRQATMAAQRSVGVSPVAQMRIVALVDSLADQATLDALVDVLATYASLGAERRVACFERVAEDREQLLEGLAEVYSLQDSALDVSGRLERLLPHLQWADLVFNFGPQPTWQFVDFEPPPDVRWDASISFSTALMHSADLRDEALPVPPPGALGAELHGFGEPGQPLFLDGLWRRLQEETEEERWQAAAQWLLDNTQSPFLILSSTRMDWSPDAAYLLLQGLNDYPHAACWVLDLPRWAYRTGWHTERGWFPLRGDFSGSRAYCFSRAALAAFMAEEHPFFSRLGVGQGLSHWGPAYGHAPSLARSRPGVRRSWDETVGFQQRCRRDPRRGEAAWANWRPLVSLALPLNETFDDISALTQTVNSVLQQSYQNWELLIVPTIAMESRLEWLRHHPRITVFRPHRTRDQHPLLVGLEASSGELVGWLDRPHQLEVSALSAAVSQLLASPEHDAIRSGGRLWDGSQFGEELRPQQGEFFLLRRQALARIDPLRPDDRRLETFHLGRPLYLHHVPESLV